MSSFIDRMFDRSVPGLAKAMDLTWRRHEAISSNIANAETPLYRAVDLNFARELDQAFGEEQDQLLKTDSKHLDIAGTTAAHLAADLTGATKPDGNNVDIDIQMGKLAQNSGQYSIAAGLMRKKLSVLRRAITDAR